MRNNKGLTLFQLTVAIIILIILAAIMITATIGKEGIVNKSLEAKEGYEIADIEEQIHLARVDSTDMENDLLLDKEKLLEELNAIEGVDDVKDDTEAGEIIVKYKNKEKRIPTKDARPATNEEFADYVNGVVNAHENTTRAFDAYMNEIEGFRDHWYYEKRQSSNSWQLNTDAREAQNLPAYQTDNIDTDPNFEDRVWVGQIPAYIIDVVDGVITYQGPVTSYKGLFVGLTDLKGITDDFVVPDQIEKMQKIFSNTQVTQIPLGFLTMSDNVKNVENMFWSTKIKSAKVEIGKNVTEANGMFAECDDLTELQIVVPAKVKAIKRMFKNAEHVDGSKSSITISGNPAEYEDAFYDLGKEADTKVKVYYDSGICLNAAQYYKTQNNAKVDFVDTTTGRGW